MYDLYSIDNSCQNTWLYTSTIKQIPHFACICLFHSFLMLSLLSFIHLAIETFCLAYSWHSRLFSKFCIPSSIVVQWPAILLFFFSFCHLVPPAWNSIKSLEIAIRPHHTPSFLSVVSSFKRSASAAFRLSPFSQTPRNSILLLTLHLFSIQILATGQILSPFIMRIWSPASGSLFLWSLVSSHRLRSDS